MVKQKLSSQLQTARDSFNVIAEKQANATKLMADSLSVVGKALEKMADNDEKRIANEKKLLDLYENILEKILPKSLLSNYYLLTNTKLILIMPKL